MTQYYEFKGKTLFKVSASVTLTLILLSNNKLMFYKALHNSLFYRLNENLFKLSQVTPIFIDPQLTYRPS